MGWRYIDYSRNSPLSSQVFLPEEVWHEKLPNPFDFWRGMSPLAVAAGRAADGALQEVAGAAGEIHYGGAEARQRQAQDIAPIERGVESSLPLVAGVGSRLKEGLEAGGIDVGLLHAIKGVFLVGQL